MGEWRSRVTVSVVEEGTERPGSEIEAETTVQAPGPQSATMAALAWVRAHALEATPAGAVERIVPAQGVSPRLELFELGVREAVAFVDREGKVIPLRGLPSMRGKPHFPGQRYSLPGILFGDVPVPLHLTAGIMVAPFDQADELTGPWPRRVTVRGKVVDENSDERGFYAVIEQDSYDG